MNQEWREKAGERVRRERKEVWEWKGRRRAVVWIEWGTPAERWSLEVASLVRYAACTIFFHLSYWKPPIIPPTTLLTFTYFYLLSLMNHFWNLFFPYNLITIILSLFPSYLTLHLCSSQFPPTSRMPSLVSKFLMWRPPAVAVVHKMGPTLFLNHEYHPWCSGLIRIPQSIQSQPSCQSKLPPTLHTSPQQTEDHRTWNLGSLTRYLVHS